MTSRSKASIHALSREEVSEFARACAQIANSSVDEHGFVPVKRLLERFNARLFIRPLLVEGMLAPLPTDEGWAVLVDSETYGVKDSDVTQERADRPLQERLRFTIAHELIHSIAFRPSEFGIRLRDGINTDDAKGRVVAALEGLTDRLTPLLLVAEGPLVAFCKAVKVPSASHLAELRRNIGVSRMVLINRLRMLLYSHVGGAMDLDAVKNVGICMGEWGGDGRTAVLRSWPVLVNFDRNIVPEFLLKLLHQDRLPAETTFPDRAFVLCGGQRRDVELTVAAGTPNVPNAERMSLECTVEAVSPRAGSTFLILVRKL